VAICIVVLSERRKANQPGPVGYGGTRRIRRFSTAELRGGGLLRRRVFADRSEKFQERGTQVVTRTQVESAEDADRFSGNKIRFTTRRRKRRQ